MKSMRAVLALAGGIALLAEGKDTAGPSPKQHELDMPFKGMWEHGMRRRKEAKACHQECGADAACHNECPKPWKRFHKLCGELQDIRSCRDKCALQDEACIKSCPTFSCPRLAKKMAWLEQKDPSMLKEKMDFFGGKCTLLDKVMSCHKSCQLGDFECHSKCPSFWSQVDVDDMRSEGSEDEEHSNEVEEMRGEDEGRDESLAEHESEEEEKEEEEEDAEKDEGDHTNEGDDDEGDDGEGDEGDDDEGDGEDEDEEEDDEDEDEDDDGEDEDGEAESFSWLNKLGSRWQELKAAVGGAASSMSEQVSTILV